MLAGYTCRIWPFGPFTSIAPSATLTVTPFGSVIGFFPIRDMTESHKFEVGSRKSEVCRLQTSSFRLTPSPSPYVAEHFSTDSGFDSCSARHHTARRRQNARAEAREHFGHVFLTEVDAAAGTADALDTGDEP